MPTNRFSEPSHLPALLKGYLWRALESRSVHRLQLRFEYPSRSNPKRSTRISLVRILPCNPRTPRVALQQARTWCASRIGASERPGRARPRLRVATVSGTARHLAIAASARRRASVVEIARSPRARICGHYGMCISQAVDNTYRSWLGLAHKLSQQTSKAVTKNLGVHLQCSMSSA